MEGKYIREFIDLAETLNFQESADRLFISQSSLSKHIKTLETELGVPLFERTTRSVKLSPYGDVFLRYAQQIDGLFDECSGALNRLNMDNENHLSIGFLGRFEQCGIFEMMSEFSKTHSHISLRMAPTAQPREFIRTQKCNFVFDAETAPGDKNMSSVLYKTDRLVAVFPLDHPFAKAEYVTFEQLRNQDFIMHSELSGDFSLGSQSCYKLCQNAGFEPNVVITTSYTSTVIKLVRQGNGIAVVHRMHIPAAIASGVAIVDIYPSVTFPIYMLYSKKSRTSPAEKEFLAFIKERGEDETRFEF